MLPDHAVTLRRQGPESGLLSAPSSWSSTEPPSPVSIFVFGNRCGHDPRAPRFHQVYLPTDANPARPVLLTKAIGQLRSYYHTPRDARWDDLSQGERRQRLIRQLDAASEPLPPGNPLVSSKFACWRQQRSERREALIALLSLMLYYTDIPTLTVAIPHGNDWLGLSAPWLAQQTMLSLSRVKRAIATLARCRLLINTGRGRQFDRRRRCWVGIGWGPVRQFSFRFIQALGLAVSWQQAQRKVRKEARLAVPSPVATPVPATLPVLATDRAPLAQTAATLTPHTQRERAQSLRQAIHPAAASADTRHAATPEDLARNRRLAELAIELAIQGLSLAEIRRLQQSAQGLSSTEIRQHLNEAAQPP